MMKSILSLFSVLLSPQPFFFLLWNASKPYLLCSVPIRKLVGAAIGATKRNVCVCTAWHMVNKSEKVVNGVVCELNFIRDKEFCPISDTFLLEVCKTMPRHIRQEPLCCRIYTGCRVQSNIMLYSRCHNAIVYGSRFILVEVDSVCFCKGW